MNKVTVELSDEALLQCMKAAHESNITFNQFVEKALKEAILNAPIDFDIDSVERWERHILAEADMCGDPMKADMLRSIVAVLKG